MSASAGWAKRPRRRVFLGTWSTIELLAHLAGWDWTNLAAMRGIRRRRLPGFLPLCRPRRTRCEARLVRRHGSRRYASRRSIEETHAALLEALERLPAGELSQDHDVRRRATA